MIIAKRVVFSGSVQGVGFRYTTAGVARSFDVKGFVRNLRDGRVELVVEGDAPEVERFVATIGERMQAHIRGQTLEDVELQGFADFAIAS